MSHSRITLSCAFALAFLSSAADAQVPTSKRAFNALRDSVLKQLVNARGASNFSKTVDMAERVTEGARRAHGPTSREFALWLRITAEMRVELDGATHPEYADVLYAAATRVLEASRGTRDTTIASLELERAGFWGLMPDVASIEQHAARALRLFTDALGPTHPRVADALLELRNAAGQRQDWRSYAEIEERAAAILEASSPPASFRALHALVLRADARQHLGPPGSADSLRRLALAHPAARRVGGWLLPFRALLASAAGQDTVAIALQREYLHDSEVNSVHPGADPKVVEALVSLAHLYWARRDFVRADSFFDRVLTETAKPPYPPNLRAAYSADAALFYGEAGNVAKGATLLATADSLYLQVTRRLMAQGSERDARYLARMTHGIMDATTQFRSSHPTAQATRVAATAVLRRKTLDLDILANEFATARAQVNGDDPSLAGAWLRARSELARASVGNAPPRVTDSLAGTVARLGTAVARSSTAVPRATDSVSLAQVQAAIPPNGVLVEFTRYDVATDVRRENILLQPRVTSYGAYIIRRAGEVGYVDLGHAIPIDSAVTAFRESLQSARDPRMKERSRALYDLVVRPLRPLLARAEIVLLSPDGDLNLVPFAATMDEHDRYLVQDFTIGYLTTGRDVIRLQSPHGSSGRPVLIGNVTYGPANVASAPAPESWAQRRSADMPSGGWKPLAGTAMELDRIHPLFPDAVVLDATNASEAALMRHASPRILHIATHGFFLGAHAAPAGAQQVQGGWAGTAPLDEAPLLRSGLVLTGANRRDDGDGGDGILTAFEAATLDLTGTELVVLSACETGLGEVGASEGVQGLRRALALAGARSQLMSLWRVDDEITAGLMADFYARLAANEGRAAALRSVQIDMLTDPERNDPYYWASFVPIGDWRPLPQTGAGAQPSGSRPNRSGAASGAPINPAVKQTTLVESAGGADAVVGELPDLSLRHYPRFVDKGRLLFDYGERFPFAPPKPQHDTYRSKDPYLRLRLGRALDFPDGVLVHVEAFQLDARGEMVTQFGIEPNGTRGALRAGMFRLHGEQLLEADGPNPHGTLWWVYVDVDEAKRSDVMTRIELFAEYNRLPPPKK